MKASPINPDEGDEILNEIVDEPQADVKAEEIQMFSDDAVQDDEEPIAEEAAPVEEELIDEAQIEAEAPVEEAPVEETPVEEAPIADEAEEIDEPSENEVAVPYEEEDDEAKQLNVEEIDEYVEPELTQEEMEKLRGIEIPICTTYNNDRVAMHLR